MTCIRRRIARLSGCGQGHPLAHARFGTSRLTILGRWSVQPLRIVHDLPTLELSIAAIGLNFKRHQTEEPPVTRFLDRIPAHSNSDTRRLEHEPAMMAAAGGGGPPFPRGSPSKGGRLACC